MKQFLFIAILSAFFTGTLFLNTVMAENETDAYLGTPKMCLDTSRIKETLILDDQTILFKMYGGALYLNRLPIRCHGLKLSNGYSYSTSIAKICKQDSITTLSTGSGIGTVCALGEFWPFKYDGESREAIKHLKDGLLEELVASGVFKEMFPEKE